ncbi:hypothetical protein LGT41_0000665 [Abyssibius alkaniclasticus]|uniref:hypothetical protein n=1 Tax=Abyssibius alkaniclasticus TaxID=2881234 RepID=UPI00236362A4|nr:hypothetical protein [Abyssibius alkaniclasticus]UPH71357.1 hypothetical protein LGT41_0000665 [Abyssibius alkaniclasticus]
MFKLFLALAFAIGMGGASQAQAELRGPAILTVTGDVANYSRGAMDPDYDKLFDYNGVAFSSAATFDYATLATLSQLSYTTDFPQGKGPHVFEGPLLADVLRLAGVTGTTISLRALDGFTLELPLAELLAKDPILALKRDGAFLGLGDFGPSQLVFARGSRDDLNDIDDSNWVWSVFYIDVQ